MSLDSQFRFLPSNKARRWCQASVNELGGSGQREMAKICARVFGFKNQSRRNKEKLRVLTVINTFLRRASPTLLASGLVRDGHLSDVLWSG